MVWWSVAELDREINAMDWVILALFLVMVISAAGLFRQAVAKRDPGPALFGGYYLCLVFVAVYWMIHGSLAFETLILMLPIIACLGCISIAFSWRHGRTFNYSAGMLWIFRGVAVLMLALTLMRVALALRTLF